MCQTITRDPRRPIRPPESVAANLTVRWARGLKWTADRGYGYFQLGPDLYRVACTGADGRCQSWAVRKLLVDGSLAPPYVVVLPVGGSGFAASCTCAGWQFAKSSPRTCRHVSALTYCLDHIDGCGEVDDEAVERCELAARV
jgi:hypothetical protein